MSVKRMSAELVEVETKYRGWCRVLVATIRLADSTVIKREIEDHGNAAGVLPYDPLRRTAIVIRQLRAPVLYAAQPDCVEAIAGLIEQGEDAATCVKREALEEAGVRLSALEQVTTAWTMPGLSTECMTLFLGLYGEADRIGAGGGVDDEQIEVSEIALSELAHMVDSGAQIDLKVMMLVQTLRLRRPELFTPA
jgi:nudix-type nucleoside diphosphatase (YffH/AdpP family)